MLYIRFPTIMKKIPINGLNNLLKVRLPCMEAYKIEIHIPESRATTARAILCKLPAPTEAVFFGSKRERFLIKIKDPKEKILVAVIIPIRYFFSLKPLAFPSIPKCVGTIVGKDGYI